MKKSIRLMLTALALTLPLAGARAVTFTTNATITVGDTAYDGQPIVASNCTLTLNGPLTVDGVVSANGNNAYWEDGG